MSFAEFIRYTALRGFQWAGGVSFRDWLVSWVKWKDAAQLQFSDFYAKLTHSLVLDKGTGSPTFTRATTGTVQDHEGVLRTAIAGEARFTGARRVRNLINSVNQATKKSEDLTAWAATGTAVANDAITMSFGTAGPNSLYVDQILGLSRVYVVRFKIKGTAGNKVNVYFFDNASATKGGGIQVTLTNSYVEHSFVAAAGVASELYSLAIDQRSFFSLGVATPNQTFNITNLQLEDITGRTDQTTPSEYVSVGAYSDWIGTDVISNGTFNTDTTGWTAGNSTLSVVSGGMRVTNVGANAGYAYQAISTVVGTKYVVRADITLGTSSSFGVYFGNGQGSGTLGGINGTATGSYSAEFTATATTTYISPINTQAVDARYTTFDNIIVKPAIYHGSGVDGVKCFDTDLSGNPIAASTLKGYLAEAAATNLSLRSDDYNQAIWNLAGGNYTATDSGIASPIAGKNWQKIEVVASAATNITQAMVATVATVTQSVYLKKGSGATVGNRIGIYNITTAADLYYVSINYDTGVVTEVFGTGSYSVEVLGADEYRLSITVSAGISAGNTINTYVGYSGNPGTAGDYFYAIGSQLELGSSATSYIPTTTTAVTRNADVLTYPISLTSGSLYGEVTPNSMVTASGYCFASLSGGAVNKQVYFDKQGGVAYGTLYVRDTTDQAFINIGNYTASTVNKFAGRFATNDFAGTINGATPATDVSGTLSAMTQLNVGTEINTSVFANGTVRNLRLWNRALSSSELANLTGPY